jgi:hypothetical protein
MKHCDDFINDESMPLCLRRFLRYHRWPATYRIRAARLGVKRPTLYATLTHGNFLFSVWRKPQRVRVVMASRLGDVGVTEVLTESRKYTMRAHVTRLSNFSETP